MESFVLRKRRRLSHEETLDHGSGDEDSTDYKLALLASLQPDLDAGALLEALLASNGSVESANELLSDDARRKELSPRKKKTLKSGNPAQQTSLSAFNITSDRSAKSAKPLTKRGKTLHLFSPEDVEEHTPCSIIHNFLPSDEAEALLRELLDEVPSFTRMRFKLFNRVVESPHTSSFYVNSWDEVESQRTAYVYNGTKVEDVRKSPPEMLKVSERVKTAVNAEIQRRIHTRYPDGRKLKHQSPDQWAPNAAFVNCYDGGSECVGYHADQLTYLGPRAIIGSLSLGVEREFRVRKILAQDASPPPSPGAQGSSLSLSSSTSVAKSSSINGTKTNRSDLEGQIAIHLPHNSLLVMHAEMQEEWKHSIASSQTIEPHPLAGNKRINVTYRCYRDYLHPSMTPRCRCGVPCILRCVMRRTGTRGRYCWQCYAHYTPGMEGCSYFVWADFDDDGRPPWALKSESKIDDDDGDDNNNQNEKKKERAKEVEK